MPIQDNFKCAFTYNEPQQTRSVIKMRMLNIGNNSRHIMKISVLLNAIQASNFHKKGNNKTGEPILSVTVFVVQKSIIKTDFILAGSL